MIIVPIVAKVVVQGPATLHAHLQQKIKIQYHSKGNIKNYVIKLRMKKRKEDLISRQDFFMQAKSKSLHILAIAFASLPLLTVTAKAKAPSSCHMGGRAWVHALWGV